jgi:hypothetical protein
VQGGTCSTTPAVLRCKPHVAATGEGRRSYVPVLDWMSAGRNSAHARVVSADEKPEMGKFVPASAIAWCMLRGVMLQGSAAGSVTHRLIAFATGLARNDGKHA